MSGQKQKTRVCVIGAGPSGMCALYQFGLMTSRPEVVCYEKQSTWGGLWNLSWMTGTDEFGEPCHNGMYKNLWSNGPKECTEYPDYTYDEHFGKPVPSYPPRDILRGYHEGRWLKSKTDLKKMIKFNHVVRFVRYDTNRGDFIVSTKDLLVDKTNDEVFSHVIVATGIFNVPNIPYFRGIESFPGRVIHAHDFRDADHFKGQCLLVIGSSCSAEDIALQTVKFGAKSVVCSYRNKPMGFNWPENIEERPLVEQIDKSTVTFKDGSRGEFDSIIYATGYKYHFPYMEDDLRLVAEENTLYPKSLYKGILMTKGGDNRCFYIGTLNQFYSFTMFDVQATWVCKYIEGTLPGEPKTPDEMKEDMDKWAKRLATLENYYDNIDFQTDFLADLCDVTGYDTTVLRSKPMYKVYEELRQKDVKSFRDHCYASVFSGTVASKPKKPWMETFDDSNENFLA